MNRLRIGPNERISWTRWWLSWTDEQPSALQGNTGLCHGVVVAAQSVQTRALFWGGLGSNSGNCVGIFLVTTTSSGYKEFSTWLMKSNIHFRVTPRWWMRGAFPPRPYMPQWHVAEAHLFCSKSTCFILIVIWSLFPYETCLVGNLVCVCARAGLDIRCSVVMFCMRGAFIVIITKCAGLGSIAYS